MPQKTKESPHCGTLDAVRSNSDPLLDPNDSGTYLNVDPHTLSVWRSTGRYGLSYVKIGSLIRYRKSVLDKFIDDRTRMAN